MDIRTERLNIAFKASGLTQTELCARTGINKGALSSYLSGRYFPKQKSLELLSVALGVTIGYLMGFDEPAATAPAVQLSPAEDHLISVYRDLTPEGQSMVSDYADLVHDNDKYKNSIDRAVYSAAG